MKKYFSEIGIGILSGLITFYLTKNWLYAAASFLGASIILSIVFLCYWFVKIRFRAGIINIYSCQKNCEKQLENYFQESHRIAVLCVQAFHIIRPIEGAFYRSVLKRGDRSGSGNPIRLLILDPHATDFVGIRAREIGEKEVDFIKFISDTIKFADDLKNQHKVDIQVKTYSELPVYQLFIFDDRLFLSFYRSGFERHRTAMYEISEKSLLYEGFVRYFNSLWNKDAYVEGSNSGIELKRLKQDETTPEKASS